MQDNKKIVPTLMEFSKIAILNQQLDYNKIDKLPLPPFLKKCLKEDMGFGEIMHDYENFKKNKGSIDHKTPNSKIYMYTGSKPAGDRMEMYRQELWEDDSIESVVNYLELSICTLEKIIHDYKMHDILSYRIKQGEPAFNRFGYIQLFDSPPEVSKAQIINNTIKFAELKIEKYKKAHKNIQDFIKEKKQLMERRVENDTTISIPDYFANRPIKNQNKCLCRVL